MVQGLVVMNKNINDKKYNDFKKKKIFRYIYIVLSLLVIVLELLALFNVINMIWGLILFILLFFLKKML